MKAAVLGGGSWGTALALQLQRAEHDVHLWVRRAELAAQINQEHENATYLPGVRLPVKIIATHELAAAAANADLAVVAVPSEYCRDLYRRLAAALPTKARVVSATKGFELQTSKRLSEVAAEELPGRDVAALSGPSFALEVAREHPTAVVVAAPRLSVAEEIQRAVSTASFRAYSSEDVVGVEVAGALKNVIAIAAGILTGLGLGHNSLAALVTRGLVEISRLAHVMGGQEETLAGLAGLGDLVLTCTGGLSRNRRLGEAIGRGESLAEARAHSPMVAEGVRTVLAASTLAATYKVEMPIAAEMKAVLYEGRGARQAVLSLMSRPLKRE